MLAWTAAYVSDFKRIVKDEIRYYTEIQSDYKAEKIQIQKCRKCVIKY